MFKVVVALFAALFVNAQACGHENYTTVGITPVNNCIQFTVGPGTGCDWMCNYCANTLGTFNYYFTDSVCTYQTGGCVGNPIAGKVYSCCSV
jgi:hypothetical protein